MPKNEDHLLEEFLEGRISRRDLIKGLVAAGLSASAVGGLLAEVGASDVAEASAPLATKPKRGGTGRFGTVVPATDVDPVTMFNEGAIFTTQLACEYLCYPRPNYSLAPKLATSWKPNSNATVWTFHLRKGVKWHDGSAFTADDVVATFDRLTNPKNNSGALSAYKGILSTGHTRKVNSHTVQFHLDRPFSDFPYLVSAFTYNSVILPKNFKIGTFTQGGIGTGAYILTKYTPKVGATYKRNPHYWNKNAAYMNGAKLNYYADNASLALAIQAGAIDVYLDMPYQGSQALFHNSNIHIFKTPGSTYREFHMRVDKKPFNDKRVRQAVALSLDRPAIIKGVLGGYGTLGNDHLFAPAFQSSALAVKNIPQRKQNIAQAKKLLAAAGHPNGIDVTLTTEQFLEIPQYAVFAQQQLKKAGIRVHLNIEDQNTYYGTGSNQPWLDVDMGIVDWAPRGSPSQLISVAYLCSNLPAPPGWNSAHWCNRTFTHLMAEYDATLNLAKKRQIAYQAAKIMHDEVPAIVAYWFIELRGIRKNVHGIAPGPAAHLDPSPIWLSS